MSNSRRDRILEGCDFIKFTDHTITSKKDFISELERVKKTGVGFDTEETVDGLSCIAGPVFNNNGVCIAAVSLSGNAFRIESRRDEIINAVKYVGSRISEQMGYRAGTSMKK
jgi:DNA-binding IclR family transcriptional regulator